MREDEWLAATDFRQCRSVLLKCKAHRRLRLLGVACAREMWQPGFNSTISDALVAAERHADRLITNSEMSKWCQKINKLIDANHPPTTPEQVAYFATALTSLPNTHNGLRFVGHLSLRAASSVNEAWSEILETRFLQLLREIFGNPFRPVSFNPEWRTSTAVAIAQGMYDSRDFSAMPILADALQDAGCDNDDILNHCRDASGVHVRGCWVVDHVLGKS